VTAVDRSPSDVDHDRATAASSPVDLPPPRQHRVRGIVTAIAPALGLTILFVGWELYVRIFDVRKLILPKPSEIVRHVVDNWEFYLEQSWITVQEAAWGFFGALLVAGVVAAAMVHSRIVERATMPVIVLLQSVPVAAIAPVFLIWFGFRSMAAKALVAGLFAFVPFVANAFAGFRAIDAHTHELMRSVHASRAAIFLRLRVPTSLPYMFAAARICVGLALVGAVIGELYTGSVGGLGYQVATPQRRSLMDQLWGSIFVLAFIGVVTVLGVMLLERRLLRWHTSQFLTPP
jgi:NitT/TauT family transport system permease protein